MQIYKPPEFRPGNSCFYIVIAKQQYNQSSCEITGYKILQF